MGLNFIIAVCALAFATFAHGASPSDIRRDIFKNYDPKVLPIHNAGDRVPLMVGLSPLYIRDLDERTQILEMDTWIYIQWEDKHLSWDPAKYGGIETLNIPSTDVWIPDISVYTASPDVTLFPEVMTKAIIFYNGSILWVPPITLSSRCPLDLTNFPKDEQTCEVIFGPWTYGSKSLDFQLYSDVVDMTNFLNHNFEWSVESATVKKEEKFYPCCPDESYPSLHYYFNLKRKSSHETCIATMLTSFGVFIGLLMFFIHPESSSKLVLGAFAELLLAIVALHVTLMMDSPATKYRAAVDRVIPMMAMVAVFMLGEVVVVSLARVMESCRPSRWVLIVGRVLSQPFSCCRFKKYDDITDEKMASKLSSREEWNIVASGLDTIYLICAICITAVMYQRNM